MGVTNSGSRSSFASTEEAARANRQPFPLWHFGDVNQITTEPIPSETDKTPMKYFWDPVHYRRAAGDLLLDRIFSYRDPARGSLMISA